MSIPQTQSASSGKQTGNLFSIILIGLFALFSLLVAVMGIQIYQKILSTAESNNQARASLGYVAGKLRTGDEAGMVYLREENGIEVLVIAEDLGDILETRIYFYDGALWESYEYAEDALDVTYGELIVSLADFSITRRSPTLFLLSSTDLAGNSYSMHVSLRTEVN